MSINKQSNLEDVMEYLETVLLDDSNDEIEENVYTDIKWFRKCNRSEYNHVVKRMNTYLW